jgi:uncharacterized repeat protein (TIGR03847 family)
MEAGFDLGNVENLRADAVGEPGKRTFRLRIVGGSGSATLWLEKEQLQAVGLAADQLLAQLRAKRTGTNEPAAPSSESGDFPQTPVYEFRVGQLGIGYDEARDMVILLIHDRAAEADGPATLVCRAGRGRMRTLSSEITATVSAGRPRCPLCGQPMTGGPHACPGANGKTPHPD